MILRFTADSGGRPRIGLTSGDASSLVKRDGSFETPMPALAGSYHVYLSRAGTVPEGYFVKNVSLGGKDVTDSGLAIEGADAALDVVLSANSATVEGTVLDAQSNPASDVQVFCVPNSKRRLRFDLYRKVTTDGRGHFRMQGVTPGEYEFLAVDTDIDEDDLKDPEFVRPPDWTGQTIDLKEGEHKRVDLKVVVPED